MVKLRSIKTPKRGPATPGNDAQPGPVKTPRTAKTPKQTPRKRAIEGEPSEKVSAKTPKVRKSMLVVPKREEPESNSDTEDQHISMEVSQNEDSSQESTDDEVAESNEESPDVKPSKLKIVEPETKQCQEVCVIQVTNFRKTVNEAVLRNHFHECGEIVGCTIEADKSASNKVAFIKFKDHESARSAEGTQNGKLLQGLPINVQAVEIGYVHGFVLPEQKIVLFGLVEDTYEEDIKYAVCKHTEVVDIYFPKDKENKLKKYIAYVTVPTVADADKLLNMNMLNVKGTQVHILPYKKTKRYFDRDTHLFYHHPAGVFVENLPKGIQILSIQEAFSKFGPIHLVIRPHITYVVVFFQHVEVAQKVLQEEQIVVNDTVVTLHPLDGKYIPDIGAALRVGTTLYFSNIDDLKDITELNMKLKSLKMTLKSSLLKRCPLTDAFDHGIYINVSDEANAKQLLDLHLTVNNKRVNIEMYDPAIHAISGLVCMVCVESIDDKVTEVVLWKTFQTFGKILKTTVLDKMGYILFASKVDANKALAALNVTIDGKELQVVKPTKKMWLQFRRTLQAPVFKPNTFKGKSLSKFSGKFKGFQHKTTFMKKTFKTTLHYKKEGFKTPRRYP